VVVLGVSAFQNTFEAPIVFLIVLITKGGIVEVLFANGGSPLLSIGGTVSDARQKGHELGRATFRARRHGRVFRAFLAGSDRAENVAGTGSSEIAFPNGVARAIEPVWRRFQAAARARPTPKATSTSVKVFRARKGRGCLFSHLGALSLFVGRIGAKRSKTKQKVICFACAMGDTVVSAHSRKDELSHFYR